MAKKQEYLYSVLKFDRSLQQIGADEPLGVLVQEHSSKGDTLFLVYTNPSFTQSVSEVGQSVLASLPQLVAKQVEEFSGPREQLLDWFVASNRWNLYFADVQRTTSVKPIREVAFGLFEKKIAKPREPAEQIHEGARAAVRGFFEQVPLATAVGA